MNPLLVFAWAGLFTTFLFVWIYVDEHVAGGRR